MLLAIAILATLLHFPRGAVCAPKNRDRTSAAHQAAQQQYYWNEITGELQWEDPGDVPYEDDSGIRYWTGPQGEKLSEDPNGQAYNWVEYYSEDLQKTYYFNQDTKMLQLIQDQLSQEFYKVNMTAELAADWERESTWTKPADLAWRRVPVRVPR